MGTTILFTGGGTSGHVTVNLALIPALQERGWKTEYMGSRQGIERELIDRLDGVVYHPIATGKLRRYIDLNNIKDPFRVIKGVMQAYRTIRSRKPDVVFSKGGFVSVPVVLGAWLNRIPVVIHESDMSPGLANRIAMPFAKEICVTFPETLEKLSKSKNSHYFGSIVRQELFTGSRDRGLRYCGFTMGKPILLVTGGSLGSLRVNEALREVLPQLLEQYQVVHLCGKGKVDPTASRTGYRQFEYVHEQINDLLAMADVIVSRAGSNAIFEFLALHKPMLLIPLTKAASRGDQLLNAESFRKSGYAEVLFEEKLNSASLLQAIQHTYQNRERSAAAMSQYEAGAALARMVGLIEQTARRK